MEIGPQEIMDDSNLFSSGTFKYQDHEGFGTQTNGTIFPLVRTSDYFEIVINRTFPLQGNDNAPLLSLAKFLFRLGSNTYVNLRSNYNLSNFLADTSIILSNFLIVVMIVINRINQVKGKNLLLNSMFPYDAIKNIMKF